MDIPGTFEAKGIAEAKSRLTFVAAEVREPFPSAVKDAGVRGDPLSHATGSSPRQCSGESWRTDT